jgi:hypothetical protein
MNGFILHPVRSALATVNEITRQHASVRADVSVQVGFMRSILRMRTLHDIVTKARAYLIYEFTDRAFRGCMMIVF